MEHLQPKQLEHFEDLLAQSARGIHIVFDNLTIADILGKPLPEDSYFTSENMTRAQDLLTTFLEKDTFIKKQIFVDSLQRDEHELLVRTYFHLVESAVQQTSEFKH